MKLSELYALSLIEPFDVIKSLDPEKAEIIKKYNAYERARTEFINSGASYFDVTRFRYIKKRYDCEPGNAFDSIKIKKRSTNDTRILELVNRGYNCAAIARMIGENLDFTRRKLHDFGYFYNKLTDKWEKQ